ncbi:MAG: 50S ribosomal protein L18 [Candidatus Omnitrophota bacterium]|jgi:large subunit ribosomal protein L18|nr:50S ribosomal protein L18 [Candidatus Omnitrophota bacterium]
MPNLHETEYKRVLRHSRIRDRVFGTPDRLRLCVHRSHKNFSVQIIDDVQGKVLLGMSTLAKEFKNKVKNGGNKEAAQELGKVFAHAAQKNGIKKVCFDRGGYLYHGRVKAFADAAREAGLEF